MTKKGVGQLTQTSNLAARLRVDAQRGRDMVAKCEVKGYPRGDDYPLADSRAGDLMWELTLRLDEAADLLLNQEQSSEELTTERNWNVNEADRQASLAAELNADLIVANVRLEAAEGLLWEAEDYLFEDIARADVLIRWRKGARAFLSPAPVGDEYIRRVNAVGDELDADGVTYDPKRFQRLTDALTGGDDEHRSPPRTSDE